ncbi:MAG: glycosyltransferase [Chloroflexi bacterium]|nr:MAG: glycosyltransferase [Chloroflexota bacterium]
MKPKVSVVIPTYNSAAYITATVESVLAQTFTDYELIVVDDGSTDDTARRLQPYMGRLTYIYQENKKYSGARNAGLRAATGEYVALLDSDDLWLPDKLARQVVVMDAHPDVVLCNCQAAYIDPQGRPTHFRGQVFKGREAPGVEIFDALPRLFTFDLIITTSTVMIRRTALDQVGLFDDTHIHGEDWELWVRLASQGRFAYLPDALAQYRVYGWQKVIRAESRDEWVSDQFRTIQRAADLWPGDPAERDRLQAAAAATVYRRAALANFQLRQADRGQVYLAKAIEADPALAERDRLVEMAVSRGREIFLETGLYDEAVRFIHTFFHALPPAAEMHRKAGAQAIAWLYLQDAADARQNGDPRTARRLLARGLRAAPAVLKNRGVVSLALDLWLGRTIGTALRRAGRSLGLRKGAANA